MSKPNRDSEPKKAEWFERALADCLWIKANREYLIQNFKGKFVAVVDHEVIAFAKTKHRLLHLPGYTSGCSPVLWYVPYS